jgi:hypothetical protein
MATRYLALDAAQVEVGTWRADLTLVETFFLGGCLPVLSFSFLGPYDPAAGGCLPRIAPPVGRPTALCLGAAPVAPVGPLPVRLCGDVEDGWCSADRTYLGGTLTVARAP